MKHDLLISMNCMGLGVYDMMYGCVKGEEVKSLIWRENMIN